MGLSLFWETGLFELGTYHAMSKWSNQFTWAWIMTQVGTMHIVSILFSNRLHILRVWLNFLASMFWGFLAGIFYIHGGRISPEVATCFILSISLGWVFFLKVVLRHEFTDIVSNNCDS